MIHVAWTICYSAPFIIDLIYQKYLNEQYETTASNKGHIEILNEYLTHSNVNCVALSR